MVITTKWCGRISSSCGILTVIFGIILFYFLPVCCRNYGLSVGQSFLCLLGGIVPFTAVLEIGIHYQNRYEHETKLTRS